MNVSISKTSQKKITLARLACLCLHSLQTFRSNIDRRSRSQKIRLFCSLVISQSSLGRLRSSGHLRELLITGYE